MLSRKKDVFFAAARLIFLASLLLASCKSPNSPAPTASPTVDGSAGTAVSPAPATASATSIAKPTSALSPKDVVDTYLMAWKNEDYPTMYGLLTPESRAGISADAFAEQVHSLMLTMTVSSLETTLTKIDETGDEAKATVHVKYGTMLVNTLEADITMPLRREAGAWQISYSPALLWPDLTNGQTLYMLPDVALRGTIYDRTGTPLVEDNVDVYAIGVVPGEIESDKTVASLLGQLWNVPANDIVATYQNAAPDQYLPLGEAPVSVVDKRFSSLHDLAGVKLTEYNSRYYYGNGVAAHITGYVSYLNKDELEEYLAKGYSPDQRVGRSGLEKWGEAWLTGHNGGSLVLMSPDNKPVKTLFSTASAPSQNMTTTVDAKLQAAVKFAFADLVGAAVVMNPQTGEVLALYSSPTYDPNLFDAFNINSASRSRIFDDQRHPLNNRAAQSAYPAGSIFKVVTMAAGLTSGLFTPATEYTCNGKFEELPGVTLNDWKEGGHGTINLVQGLTGSCNPWFFHIGYALFKYNQTWESETAHAFGLGQPTGIGQIDEASGLIPDPAWKLKNKGEQWEPLDATNLAVGQGDTLVTPLQIARMFGAVANGGTLYQPQLVLSVQAQDGTSAFTFKPIATGQLPVTPDQLAAIQQGLRDVTRDCVGCIGTARDRFRGLAVAVAGKTGTAEDPGFYGTQDPDAWFAGYTLANRKDKPDIAIAVVVTNQGQGSAFAAPIFRRIVESYFGLPLVRYPWESSVGVVPTPTPTPGAEDMTPTP